MMALLPLISLVLTFGLSSPFIGAVDTPAPAVGSGESAPVTERAAGAGHGGELRLAGEVFFVQADRGLLSIKDSEGRLWPVRVTRDTRLFWNGAAVRGIAVFAPLGPGIPQDVKVHLLPAGPGESQYRALEIQGRLVALYGRIEGLVVKRTGPTTGLSGATDEMREMGGMDQTAKLGPENTITVAVFVGAPGDTDETATGPWHGAGAGQTSVALGVHGPAAMALAQEAAARGDEVLLILGWEGEVKQIVLR